jgi:hypothetical protein
MICASYSCVVDPRANAVRVRHAFNALHSGTEGLSAFPVFLLEIINTDAWREVARPDPLAEPERFKRFADWIVASPPTGLGAESVDQVKRLAFETAAELPLRDALKRPQGQRADLDPNLHNNIIEVPKQGTSHSYTLDRLERERPDLKALVEAKELSANAAAIEAGFRPKTFTVRADDPVSIAKTLRRQLDTEVLNQLIKELQLKGESDDSR